MEAPDAELAKTDIDAYIRKHLFITEEDYEQMQLMRGGD